MAGKQQNAIQRQPAGVQEQEFVRRRQDCLRRHGLRCEYAHGKQNGVHHGERYQCREQRARGISDNIHWCNP